MKLEGRVAIITGAGSGIGRATSLLFAKEGAKVVVADITQEGGQETVKMIKDNGGQATFVKTDVSDAEQVKNMVKTAVDNYGQLHILYNNAAIPQARTPLPEVDEKLWDRIFAVNVKGLFLCSKYAYPHLDKTGKGVILITASLSAVRPRPEALAYGTSKGAAITFTKTLAAELAKDKIRVNCINPVACDTPMFTQFFTNYDPAVHNASSSGIPLGRMATPQDIANAALFLCSDDASLVTGTEFNVDGGRGI